MGLIYGGGISIRERERERVSKPRDVSTERIKKKKRDVHIIGLIINRKGLFHDRGNIAG